MVRMERIVRHLYAYTFKLVVCIIVFLLIIFFGDVVINKIKTNNEYHKAFNTLSVIDCDTVDKNLREMKVFLKDKKIDMNEFSKLENHITYDNDFSHSRVMYITDFTKTKKGNDGDVLYRVSDRNGIENDILHNANCSIIESDSVISAKDIAIDNPDVIFCETDDIELNLKDNKYIKTTYAYRNKRIQSIESDYPFYGPKSVVTIYWAQYVVYPTERNKQLLKNAEQTFDKIILQCVEK